MGDLTPTCLHEYSLQTMHGSGTLRFHFNGLMWEPGNHDPYQTQSSFNVKYIFQCKGVNKKRQCLTVSLVWSDKIHIICLYAHRR